MTKAASFREAIHDILHTIEHPYSVTDSHIRLVELVMLMESGFDFTPLRNKSTHRGMIGIDEDQFIEIMIKHITNARIASKNVKNVCGIDLSGVNYRTLFTALQYNFALQVLVVFYFFYGELPDAPIGIEECVQAYREKWKSGEYKDDKNMIIKMFIAYDKEARS